MTRLKPADPFPAIDVSMVSGETEKLVETSDRWTLLIVYRGDHCPRCKTYVEKLHQLAPAYAERNVDIRLASTDPLHVAKRTIAENGWTLPVACGLSNDICQQLCLYLTQFAPEDELDGQYSEPGLYLINPQGLTQVIAISNSPSVRPDLEVVLDGIIGTQERNLPIRGLHNPV